MLIHVVQPGPDVDRVASLARRQDCPEALVESLSQALRTDPSVRLRPAQAAALRELYEVGGMFAPMRVGSGKTLVSLLSPTLAQAQRPVLVVPAALRDKTRAEYAQYAKQWRVRLPRLMSYEELSRKEREYQLLQSNPDLLILDEAHKVKNKAAAVTRRVGRCIELLRPRVVALSGTLITDDLMDWWHIIVWCLGERAPVAMSATEAERWAQAVNRDPGNAGRIGLGALARLGDYHAWVRGTRGVIPTPGKDCDASIEIHRWRPELPQELADAIAQVRETGLRPDGELLEDTEVVDCMCQLALGFYYVWDPLPPKWWLEPRRKWNAWVRWVLEKYIEGLDSPAQIVHALDGHVCDEIRYGVGPKLPMAAEGRQLLAEWRQVRDQFEPNPVPVWINDEPLRKAAKSERGTLVWVKYRAAGERLASMGVPYYGGGTNPQQARPGSTIALSISAHGTGRNLQAWHRSLVLTPPANCSQWEQIIGRTHRAGQTSDTVYVHVVDTIEYHDEVMSRVKDQARATTEASGFASKITDATWV